MAALPDARRSLGRPRGRAVPPAKGRAELALLAGYGAVSALLYGVALNFSFWPLTIQGESALSFVPGAPVVENLQRFFVFSVSTSLGWDLGRALTNVALILLTGRAVLGALRRAARKAAFDAPVRFDSPTDSLPFADPRGTSDERSPLRFSPFADPRGTSDERSPFP
ncbi:hypothetical protein GCM10022199_15960 [Marihabitans asiaticum]|uniref:hypothetical protein n=1 Tax=Marihabitans asiaticum TaxID=415218 RepID=UPI001B86E001|nr:hypothetical protein [Marihabitans asiaticum]